MKYYHYIYIVATAALLIGCNNDLVEPAVPNNGETDELSFSGSIDDELELQSIEGCDGAKIAETRSTYENGEFTSWDTKDKISISDGDKLYYQYTVSEVGSPASSCTFNISAGKNAFEKKDINKDYYVFYPAEVVEEWQKNGKVTARVFAEQDYSENDNGGAIGTYMASVADVTKDADGNKKVHFSFKHVASVIEVDLSSFNETYNQDAIGRVEAVSIMTNNHMPIAGRFDYSINDKSFTVATDDRTDYAASTQSDVVTVSNIPSSATKVRFYVLPVQITGGVTITVRTSNSEYYSKSTSNTIGANTTTDFTVSGITAFDSGKATSTVCKPYYKLINFGAVTANTKINDYMGTIPSNTYFSKISTMGAHNAAASDFASGVGNTSRNWSRTQSMPIYTPDSETSGSRYGMVDRYGIRAFDLRTPYRTSEIAGTISGGKYVGKCTEEDLRNTMPIFHGITQTAYGFIDVVTRLKDYVANHKTEVITIMFNKEENIADGGGTDNTTLMWTTINNLFAGISDYIHVGFTENLTLGDVRGKLIIMNRRPKDDGKEGFALCPKAAPVYNWGDNQARAEIRFNTDDSNVKGIIEDEYEPEGSDSTAMRTYKLTKVKPLLDEASANTEPNTYHITYSAVAASGSITQFVWTISSIAKSVNYHMVNDNYITSHSGSVGYVFGDYLGTDDHTGHKYVKAVLTQNAKYVNKGRTRCIHESTTYTGATVSGSENADDGPVYIKRK